MFGRKRKKTDESDLVPVEMWYQHCADHGDDFRPDGQGARLYYRREDADLVEYKHEVDGPSPQA